MSWELFTSIVDQIPDLQRAVLHGVGEPMLVKNLPKMVRYLKDRGTYVLFNTNGTVLNERNGRALIDAGLDELRVSLDAANAEVLSGHPRQGLLQPHPQERPRLPQAAGARRQGSAARLGLADRPEGDHRRAARPSCRSPPTSACKEVYLQRLVFFENDAIGLARPDQALYEQMTRDEAVLSRGGHRAGALLRHDVQRVRRRLGAGHEPQARTTTARPGRCAGGPGR